MSRPTRQNAKRTARVLLRLCKAALRDIFKMNGLATTERDVEAARAKLGPEEWGLIAALTDASKRGLVPHEMIDAPSDASALGFTAREMLDAVRDVIELLGFSHESGRRTASSRRKRLSGREAKARKVRQPHQATVPKKAASAR